MKREEAIQLRKILEMQTESMTDKQALKVATYVERWKPDTIYKEGKRVAVVEGEEITLYRVVQEHTSQAQYPPSQDTASLYTRIDEEHAGTKEDPIPYRVNIEVFADKYYIEDDVVYRCIRDSGIALQNKASELVGIYFEVV